MISNTPFVSAIKSVSKIAMTRSCRTTHLDFHFPLYNAHWAVMKMNVVRRQRRLTCMYAAEFECATYLDLDVSLRSRFPHIASAISPKARPKRRQNTKTDLAKTSTRIRCWLFLFISFGGSGRGWGIPTTLKCALLLNNRTYNYWGTPIPLMWVVLP